MLFDAAPERCAALNDQLRQRGLAARRVPVADWLRGAAAVGSGAAVVVAAGSARSDDDRLLVPLVQRLATDHVASLVWGGDARLQADGGPLTEWLAADAGLDEVAAKIGTLTRYAPLLHAFERELEHFGRLGDQLNQYFTEIDQEMRLAGRLQRDFMPRRLPDVPPYTCQVLYRPASWVGGDMYDAFRIDEGHLGLFIADAMGHGVAAGLLTMFLRQALTPKRIDGDSYTILTPAEALTNLNDCLVQQKLPNCYFVTACYGVLDILSGKLHLARAGHPYALHIRADGGIAELRSEGSLLGLADVATVFQVTTVPLAPGDKVLFYTDGLEDALLLPRRDDVTRFTPELAQWARLSSANLVAAIAEHLDRREGSLHPADDVTLLVLEVASQAR
jgi:serine phosphatase RsbU (regulator of sigma subunit)